jgi:hypothetical protein
MARKSTTIFPCAGRRIRASRSTGSARPSTRGFRVTTNTTLFDGADPNSVRAFFDEMMEVGVESMMLSPGYSYDKAPDQKHFMGRARTRRLFRAMLLQSQEDALALQPVAAVPRIPDGQAQLQVHALGHADLQHLRLAEALLPAAGRLCGVLQRIDGNDRVGEYGTESGNPQCANCMVHCGYEASSVDDTFGSKGIRLSRRRNHHPQEWTGRSPDICSTAASARRLRIPSFD